MNQVTAWDDAAAVTGGVRQSCVWGRPLTQQMLDFAEVCYLRGKKKIVDLQRRSGKQWKNPKTLNQTEFNCYSRGGGEADVMQLSHASNLQFFFFFFFFLSQHVVKEAATDLHWSRWFWQHLNTTGRVFLEFLKGTLTQDIPGDVTGQMWCILVILFYSHRVSARGFGLNWESVCH